jgi:hypothetical protein
MVIEGMLALTGQHFIIAWSPATSTATSRSARASYATWRGATIATAT